MTITRESQILVAICTLDLVSTLLLLNSSGASEGNPLMSYYLQYGGIGAFILAKLALIVLPLFIAEWSRQYKPQFVRMMLRAAIGAYVVVYLAVFLATNVLADRVYRVGTPPAKCDHLTKAPK